MKEGISHFLKGAAMGAANVIPGVSGGTVAFITGIYERLIEALRSLDGGAVKLVLKGRIREFAQRVDLSFLIALGLGVVVSIVSLASLLEYLFEKHETYVWAFFFGLILASVIFVGRQVGRWSIGPVLGFLIGAAIAIAVALLKPAAENDSVPYLLLCGVIAMASMIIPGLSGSFVLLLLGNYQLIMIESVIGLKSLDPAAFAILVPVGIGAVIGLLLLSRILSWVFRTHHDLAVALLTGFVAGSLLIIWPWKNAIIETFGAGEDIKEKVVGYDWYLPAFSPAVGLAVLVMLLGFVAVYLMERFGANREKPSETDSDS
ncbi:MAG: DUF368 domain-containing protein [Verrucomicrobiales bacterium]|nr:DUF368 domain-containing protein [Verrucomicrobiales bacterium]